MGSSGRQRRAAAASSGHQENRRDHNAESGDCVSNLPEELLVRCWCMSTTEGGDLLGRERLRVAATAVAVVIRDCVSPQVERPRRADAICVRLSGQDRDSPFSRTPVDALHLHAHPDEGLGLYYTGEDDLCTAGVVAWVALRTRQAIRGIRGHEHYHDERERCADRD